MGCHLKCVEASAGIKQNLPGAVEHPPLTATSEVLLFFSAATTLLCVGFQLTQAVLGSNLFYGAVAHFGGFICILCWCISQLSICSPDFEKDMDLWDLTLDRRIGNLLLYQNFSCVFLSLSENRVGY